MRRNEGCSFDARCRAGASYSQQRGCRAVAKINGVMSGAAERRKTNLDVVNIGVRRLRASVERSMEKDEEPPEHEMDAEAMGQRGWAGCSCEVDFGREIVFPCVQLDAARTNISKRHS